MGLDDVVGAEPARDEEGCVDRAQDGRDECAREDDAEEGAEVVVGLEGALGELLRDEGAEGAGA